MEDKNYFLVAPSILSADFSRLGEELLAIEKAGADWAHVDVMDGHFVPNLTIGAPVVRSLRPLSSMVLDVHLMIDKPEKYIEDFVKAGANYLTIHVESTDKPEQVLKEIRRQGVKAGITLKPGTDIDEIIPFLSMVDLVLVMTVEPGFGGQSFMEDQVKKMEFLNQWREKNGVDYLIEVDGGVSDKTKKHCVSADVLVAGSFVFKGDYKERIKMLRGKN